MYINYINLLHKDYLKQSYEDLTPSDVTYLVNIFYHQNCSHGILAEQLFVSESNVDQIIKRLERNEYITRVPDERYRNPNIKISEIIKSNNVIG
ncbi:MAG: MarR family transcriptional regulator [Methanobrevibacter thaueri]|jgi:DNA-binding MarR family transcriptional regulator|uniref:MarR family transcriptional regulator n=1 Tax=Methanobrevibacter thaueri TaxID=190975 RepID=UPI0026ED16F0|nr:MarR family transcriptional regulator [Methanobrevibacter thaueri]MBE6496046.1 MarR family transcriptional regulator [Methanobrevibacter thaueri]